MSRCRKSAQGTLPLREPDHIREARLTRLDVANDARRMEKDRCVAMALSAYTIALDAFLAAPASDLDLDDDPMFAPVKAAVIELRAARDALVPRSIRSLRAAGGAS